MKANDGEDEAKTQDKHNNGINAETRALIGVQLQHGAGGATCAGRTSGGRTSIAQRFFVVGSGTATHGRTRTARRSRG